MKKLLLLSIAILSVAKINAQTYYTSSNAAPVSFGMTSTLTIPAGDTVYIQNIPDNIWSSGNMDGSYIASVYAVTPVYFTNVSNKGSQYIGSSSRETKNFKFVALTYTFSVNGYTQYNISSPAGGSNLVFFTKTDNGVGITENYTNKINFSVYPNPTSNSITVKLPVRKKYGVYKIELSNMFGEVCKEISSVNTKAEIDLSQFQSGIYFLQVFEEGNLVAVQKIVKE